MPFAALIVSLASSEYPSAMRGLLPWSESSEAVAEAEFERAAGLQALREQGGGTALGRVRDDQLMEPAGVGADRVRAGHGQLVEYPLGCSHPVDGERGDAAGQPGHERVQVSIGQRPVDPAVPLGHLGVEVVRAENRLHGPAPSQQSGQVLYAARAWERAGAHFDLTQDGV